MNATLEPSTTGKVVQAAGKYLLFQLGGESYGISVLKVREIIRLTTITAVPQMPDCVKGVINLRGKIVPVMDLRLRFGLPATDNTDQTCIVVVQITTAEARINHMGLVVDGVEEVAQIAATDIEEAPDFGAEVSTECLLGMAKIKGIVKTLLDIDKVLGHASLPLPTAATPTPPATR